MIKNYTRNIYFNIYLLQISLRFCDFSFNLRQKVIFKMKSKEQQFNNLWKILKKIKNGLKYNVLYYIIY